MLADMIKAFSLALAQLGERNILILLLKTIALTLVLFAVLGVGLYFGVEWALDNAGWRLDDRTESALVGLLAVIATFFAGWLWFRVVAIAVLQVFGDEIVMAVERKYYSATISHAASVGFVRSLKMGIGSLVRALLLNLLALPIYIILLPTAIGLPIAFLIVNAFLLGRDLQDMVVARHSPSLSDPKWTIPFSTRFVLGLVTAAIFLVPFINLLAPIIGASMATHLVHGRQNAHSGAHNHDWGIE